MTAKEEYIKVFGSIQRLSEDIPWTTGLSNMFEHLTWSTMSILGISKTEFWKLIINISERDDYKNLNLDQKLKFIGVELKKLQSLHEGKERHDKPKSGYCSPREALRRAKYFSEDYLNKEFDIFINLCSDKYLDFLYSRFIDLSGGSHWATHGNSGIFCYSTGIQNMQIDNIAYNETENVLIANELKLGGKKNKDQILKYTSMLLYLQKAGFLNHTCKFVLLFIGNENVAYDLSTELDKEMEYCRNTKKVEYLLDEKIVANARNIILKSLSWNELIELNDEYLNSLSGDKQVEIKLISGFNIALRRKWHIQKSL